MIIFYVQLITIIYATPDLLQKLFFLRCAPIGKYSRFQKDGKIYFYVTRVTDPFHFILYPDPLIPFVK